MQTRGTVLGGGTPTAHLMQREHLDRTAPRDPCRGTIPSLCGVKSSRQSQGKALLQKAMPARGGYCLQGKGLLVRCRGKRMLGSGKASYGMFGGGGRGYAQLIMGCLEE